MDDNTCVSVGNKVQHWPQWCLTFKDDPSVDVVLWILLDRPSRGSPHSKITSDMNQPCWSAGNQLQPIIVTTFPEENEHKCEHRSERCSPVHKSLFMWL